MRTKKSLNSVFVESGGLTASEIRFLVGKDNPTIVEIGANIGQTTAEMLKAMPNARIYCFEPDPRAIAKFKENVTNRNVTLIECAVGNESGTVVFHQSSGEGEHKDWDQSGSIRKPKTHTQVWPQVKFKNTIEVPIIRLDDWAKSENLLEIDFVWADVQGAEIDLIKGGLDTLNKAKFFYTEYSNAEWYEGQIPLAKLYELLEKYSILRLFQMDVLFENMFLNQKKSDEKMKLHIGGTEKKEGWKILNIQSGDQVDFIGNISDLSQFPDGSCDQIYASHVLEHIPQKDVISTLQGIRRILKPRGQFLVSVPDWDVLCHSFINPAATAEVKWHVLRMMMGGQVDQNDFHYAGFNQVLLYDFLRQAGFSNANRVDSFGIFNDTSDYRPFGFPISLNVVATK